MFHFDIEWGKMSTLEGQVKTPVTSRSTPINIVKRTNHGINIGDRVKANSYSGVVRFIGTTQFKTGTWAGIELDIAGTGKNDGSVEG